jgi:4-hydroxythreonine-4-phosphate dehydrogenase
MTDNTTEDTMGRPIVGITMGDAAGIGPEIIVRTLAKPEVHETVRALVIGDLDRLARANQICGTGLELHAVSDPGHGRYQANQIDVVDLHNVPAELPFGALSAEAGQAAYEYIVRTVELARAGQIGALCTAPLNKEALHAAGHRYPGHTELLAELTGTPEVSMMLTAPGLRVVHVTTHLGLLDAIDRIEPGLVERTLRRAHAALVSAGIARPRLGVCGINPHAGENGLFGSGEEEHKIAPGVAAAVAAGIDATGPLPADTLFTRAIRGDFDIVVAMYHDQGHCPIKALSMDLGVNITIGLPIIRTSVDHGTAFDIAGTGKASEASMVEALRQAAVLAPPIEEPA